MKTRLTLTIDKSLIGKAKRYAKQKKLSLSDMIEQYLRAITEEIKIEEEFELTPIVKSLKGSFKAPKEFEYKEELTKIVSEKYLQK